MEDPDRSSSNVTRSPHCFELKSGQWVETECPAQPSPERASLPQKARRLAMAAKRWAGSGFSLVGAVARLRRKRACKACDYWRPMGNLGMGECQAPGCGCTRLKRWLETERCPLGKWPV